MAADPRAPRMLGADANSNAAAPRDVGDAKTAIFHVESIPKEIALVLRQRDPHRHRQIAGAATEFVLRQHWDIWTRPASFHRTRAAAAHHVHPVERIERAD